MSKPPVNKARDFIIKEIRDGLKRDFFSFTKSFLNFNKLCDDNRESCEWMQERVDPCALATRFLEIQEPRETYKTTRYSISMPIWFLANDPNLSIMLCSKTQGNAKNWLRVIKRKIVMPKFRKYFGDWRLQDEWRESDITIAKRDVVKPEPSIDCVGLETTVTSKHPDIIILDDIVTKEDRDSKAEREKTIRFLDEILDLLNKEHGILFVIGTPWHVDDLFAHIEKRKNPELKAEGLQQFEIYKKPVYDNQGKLGFPSILPMKRLKQIRVMKSDIAAFSSNYLLEPIHPSTRIFKRESFGYYHHSESIIRQKIKSITMYCDPSLGETAKGDPSSIAVLGKTEKNKYAVLASNTEIRKPTKIINDYIDIYEYYQRFEIQIALWMEWNGFQALMKDMAIKRALKRDVRFPLKGYKQKENKVARITSVERFTSSRLVLFRSDWETAPGNYRDLIYQLESFPQGHDDAPDALEGAIARAERGGIGFRSA